MTENTSALERRIERLEANLAIQNVMGRRAYLHSAGLYRRELDECWSREREDIAFEPENWGVWEGLDTIQRSYNDPPEIPGMLIEHTITTGVIEVAEDGETAKGVWISPGHETFAFPGEDPIPHWCWGRYAVDFVKENGEWRIWHLHILTTFRTPYDQSWVDSAVNPPAHFPKKGERFDIRSDEELEAAGMVPPTRGVTFNQPYDVDAVPAYQPVPPSPYRTWSDVTSYTDPL